MKQIRKTKKINTLKIRRARLLTRNGAAKTVQNGHAFIVEDSLLMPSQFSHNGEAQSLENDWRSDPRWQGVTRPYSAEKVLRLRGTIKIEHTIADKMSRKLWHLLNTEPYVHALGALTGN